ncbi:hypothetical protein KFK09_014393 [Dendrobium nobile]|uniref:Uncharacterized protein n=1 Tax=Dendrobium nobile TaxID=94219 RepID=A0A8T3B3R8_DENNO|nr:hypothetical protein KFK09_014393 [Dendrobium nobile]
MMKERRGREGYRWMHSFLTFESHIIFVNFTQNLDLRMLLPIFFILWKAASTTSPPSKCPRSTWQSCETSATPFHSFRPITFVLRVTLSLLIPSTVIPSTVRPPSFQILLLLLKEISSENQSILFFICLSPQFFQIF